MNKNKKAKLVISITIGLSCFILSMIMFMQFKVVYQIDITSIETMRESELRVELANWKEQYEELDVRYNEVVSMIQEYKDKQESDNETAELLESELEEINMLLGKTDVKGEGITITIEESNNTDTPIYAEDLLVIVNALKLAGAEAISINEQRVINTTDIVEINNSFIRINGERILAPYIVKAIGDATYLESSLIGSGGYVDELRSYGYEINIEESSNIEINKYEDEIKSNYMN